MRPMGERGEWCETYVLTALRPGATGRPASWHRFAIEQYPTAMDANQYHGLVVCVCSLTKGGDEGQRHADKCGYYGSARCPG
jgi:hypothetical protein